MDVAVWSTAARPVIVMALSYADGEIE